MEKEKIIFSSNNKHKIEEVKEMLDNEYEILSLHDIGFFDDIVEDGQTFEIGKGVIHGDGTDATVFATGVTVVEALKAQEKLKEEGIDIRVIDIHTIKPIDKELVIRCAKETKKLISIEDHSIIGGLGSAISEVLTDECPCKLIRMGVNDCFGKSGKAEELLKYYKLTCDDIVNEVKK